MDEMRIVDPGSTDRLDEPEPDTTEGMERSRDFGEQEDYEDQEPDDDFLAEGQRLLGDAEAKLAAVERALARLDAGAYGLCEVCNEPIEPGLLAERPSLSRCGQHGGAES